MKRFADDPVSPSGNVAHHPWSAHLTLGFAPGAGADAATTRLIERTHVGQLRVQKALYPEGPNPCHAIVVHPPGGVVGGDRLAITIRAAAGASAFVTTPGAGKWYRANGNVSEQQVNITVEDGASLEWMPQETILFDAANVGFEQNVVLGKDAVYIGCEVLCFGRTASGESFASGRVRQRTSIRRDGRQVWFEQGVLEAGSNAMKSASGLGGKTVCATFIGVGGPASAAVIAGLREAGAEIKGGNDAFGVTQMKSVVVVRYLGDSSEVARELMMLAWKSLRPALSRREAVVPRIWNT